jgi:peptidoglycan-associated lipoprotein
MPNEEQTIGAVVPMVRNSPVVDEVMECDDVAGDDAAALARAAGVNLTYRTNTEYKNPKGEQMKTATKTVTAFLSLLCLLALAGCPKKAVVTPPTPEPVREPVVEEEPDFGWSLASIHFDFDKSEIRSGDATTLQGNYDQMRSAAARNQRPDITIEGYCDPIGTSEYNMALGMRRAEATKAYLVRLGAGASQLTTISYGEERLVTQDPDQFELNRRCEFKVTK